jgi:hypothetical protein
MLDEETITHRKKLISNIDICSNFYLITTKMTVLIVIKLSLIISINSN